MAGNKTKTDRIHDQISRFFRTRQNPNWKALVGALGESDENLSDLIEEVRKQFFVKTASRPYLDRLGSNVSVSRPRFVGMDDPTFRTYIPVLAYQPKQVKLVLDLLLDIFFFKESTTAFNQSTNFEPFNLEDGWELEYTVDGSKLEDITFNTEDFVDINNATADEVVGVINRNAQNSFAVVFDDRIQKRKFIRIFTNTIGSKGSIQITGGRANSNLRFTGFIDDAGSGSNTQWTITKVGDTMTFTHVGGTSPGLDQVGVGDVVIIEIPNNEGSFVIESVDVGTASFSFKNLFGNAGSFDHTGNPETFVRFMEPVKQVVYTQNNRSLVWEVSPGEIIVEMPASPPVVKRQLAGSAHINGFTASAVSRVADDQLEIDDATDWPTAGKFILQEREELQYRILTSTEDVEETNLRETRFDKQNIYTFTGRSGNTLTGITPNLPEVSELNEFDISTAVRSTGNVVTITTTTDHNYNIGDVVKVQNTESALSTTGIRIDVSTTDTDADVAAIAATRINAETDFSAVAIGNQVQITNSENGTATDAADVDSGLTPVVAQQGTAGQPEITQVVQAAGSTFDISGDGLRWEISSANDDTRYHVWYNVTDGANVQSNAGLDDTVDGTFVITDVPTSNQFTYTSAGELGSAVDGVTRVERFGMADTGSIVYLTSAQLGTGILGPNIWDENASFVLSALTSNITSDIKAGNNVRTIGIDSPNNIPDEEGFVVFNFGTEFEEGPVRYLYKPSANAIQLDPAYVFQNNHDAGSAITVIRRRGAHVISTTGREYAPYITDPSVARTILQELLRQTKSVGIFIDFLIRYPEQLYATLDVYQSGDPSLQPVYSEE